VSWEADVQWWEAPVNPEQIESAEFFVGMRGYERAEVRAFLAATAAEHRALLERVAELESRPAAPEPPPQVDPAEELGQHVAAILRTARESARALLADAERRRAKRTLTPHEREVLRLAADGLSCGETAVRLGTSEAAVRAKADRALDLLGTDTLPAAVRRAREAGLVPRRHAG
jgi:DivIVA domain-containing protein